MERDIKKYMLKKDKQHEILAKYYPEEMIDMKSKNMVLCDIFEAQKIWCSVIYLKLKSLSSSASRGKR